VVSAISTLPGGVGLEFIDRRLTKIMLAKGVVCQQLRINSLC
jgi:hypothetical protein